MDGKEAGSWFIYKAEKQRGRERERHAAFGGNLFVFCVYIQR
jgi:hypothetical protein